ncbi:MAG: NADP-dependent phosphogluconate dehydrogenase [Acidobacteriota bacterium]
MTQQIGVIGLGVMGQNLALNIERNGFSVAVYNRTRERTDAFLSQRAAGKQVIGVSGAEELVAVLEKPRRVLLMVKAGEVVDRVLEGLLPHLQDGDVVVDGGNSQFRDTERRQADLADRGLHFVGMGVSGGELGALHGPSLMPGGSAHAYTLLEPLLVKIAAQVDSGPCVAHLGPRGAGHLVKMVHNGIEYGLMQLISETYDLLHHGVGLSTARLSEVFGEWDAGELSSFLMEVAQRVVDFPDDLGSGKPLSEVILDRAGQKGTGKWTVQAALELGIAIPTITAGVDARLLSALKEERVSAARIWARQAPAYQGDPQVVVEMTLSALQGATICAFAQGFALMRAASEEFDYGLDLAEIARVWRGGCIIRSALLEPIRDAFQCHPQLPNLLVNDELRRVVAEAEAGWRHAVELAIDLAVPVPALSASLSYLDSYRRQRLPANLVQAMRDDFGAHTYERIDRQGTFHTDWE